MKGYILLNSMILSRMFGE